MSTQTISLEEAFRAMFYFLEHEIQLDKSEDILMLIGALAWDTWTDGRPADPAAWEDWLNAVRQAKENTELNRLMKAISKTTESSLTTEHIEPPPAAPRQ